MKLESPLQPPRNLSSFVDTDVGDARASLVWDRVAARAPWRRRPKRSAVSLVAVVAVAAAAIAIFVTRRAEVDCRPQIVEYDCSGSMTLADGSHIRLRDEGRVRLERFDTRGVELTLEQGSAEFDVAHVASRSFVVHAGRVDVVDVGTRFVVTRAAGSTSVAVEQGRVEVRDPTGALPPRTIAEGESWSSADAPRVEPPTSEPSEPSASASAPNPAPRAPSPHALMEQADHARVEGKPREAAALLDALRRHHRSDPRAGLAAFELGRLRLDALGDPSGAVEAFDDAIALAPGASFREDVEARRVEALERARDPRCREARESYLARYPAGVHVAEVTARCNR